MILLFKKQPMMPVKLDLYNDFIKQVIAICLFGVLQQYLR